MSLPGPLHPRYVLDSYALLAYLGRERGWRKVKGLLRQAAEGSCTIVISAVNLGEVLYIVERNRGLPSAQLTLARIDELPLVVVDAGRDTALAAAHLKAHHSIAYADCFAAALARTEEAALVTGDPEFKLLEKAGAVTIAWL